MKVFQVTLIAAAMLAFADRSSAVEFSVDDCLLRELKGVISDAAAGMVRRACESKRAAYEKEQTAKLEAKYGPEISDNQLDMVELKGWETLSTTQGVVQFTNRAPTGSSTVSYLRINVGIPNGAGCGSWQSYSYDVTTPPGANAMLLFPMSGAKEARLCILVSYARWRSVAWSDLVVTSWVGKYSPLPADRFPTRGSAPPQAPTSTKIDYSSLITMPPDEVKKPGSRSGNKTQWP